jgi:hypothetical protein
VSKVKKIAAWGVGIFIGLAVLGLIIGPPPEDEETAAATVTATSSATAVATPTPEPTPEPTPRPTPTEAPATPEPTPKPTAEYMLAVIHGDPNTEAEFAAILDTVQEGSEFCAPEPDRYRAGDLIYASWDEAGQPVSLLEWATLLASVCQT